MNLSPYPHLHLNIFIFLGFTTPCGNESHKLTMWHTQKPLPFRIVSLLLGCNLITYGNISKTSIFLYFKVTWQCIVNSLYLSCQKVLIVVACCLLYVTSTFVDLCSLSLWHLFFYTRVIGYLGPHGNHATPLLISATLFWGFFQLPPCSRLGCTIDSYRKTLYFALFSFPIRSYFHS